MSSEDHNLQLGLPPNFRFDQEEFLNKIVNSFKTSVEKQNIFEIKNSLSNLSYYTANVRKYVTTSSGPKNDSDERVKKFYTMLINPLFDFATALPFIDFDLQSRAAKLFTKISKRYQYRPKGIHLSLQKALDIFNILFATPQRSVKIPFPPQGISWYSLFFSSICFYLDESDGDMLLEKYLDKIGSPESISYISTLNLLRFYPVTEKCFSKIFDHLIPLIESPVMIQYPCAVFYYLNSLMANNFYVKYFDWKPYLRYIFKIISISLNSTVKVLGDHIQTYEERNFRLSIGFDCQYNKEMIPVISSSLLIYLIKEHDEEKGQKTTVAGEILSILKDLVTAFVPMITPKSKKDKNAVFFFANLIRSFSYFYSSIQYKKEKNDEDFLHINISQELVDQFVSTLLPFVQAALFNGKSQIQREMSLIVPALAQLSYDLTINALVPFCLENMVDPEMTLTSNTCFNVIKYLIPTMLNEEHIEENLTRIPKIIEASLERCKNSLLKNYYLGMSVLSEIAQFISIPADKEMNSKLSMKQRMVATAMVNSLEVILKCHFEHNRALTTDHSDNPYNNMLTGNNQKDGQTSMSSKSLRKQKKPTNNEKDMDKRFDIYFAAFDDSYIESIVIPSALKLLKNASNAAFLNNFTYKFTKYLSKAKPDLIARDLAPKLEESFIKSNITRKPFWAQVLASTFVACPTFLEKIPHYVELINNLLVFKESDKNDSKKDDQNDDDEFNCNLKCAYFLIYELIAKVPGPNIIDWSNCEEQGQIKWGVVYKKYQVHPKWYEIDINAINSAIDSIFKALQPHMQKFPTYDLKNQKSIRKILGAFLALFSMRGKLGKIDEFNDHHENETFTRVEKSIFEFINEMLQKIQSYQSLEEILSLLISATTYHINSYTKAIEVCDNLNSKKYNNIVSKSYSGCKSSRFCSLLGYHQEVLSSLYSYDYIVTPNVELVIDNVLKLVSSEFQSISHSASSFFTKFTVYSKKMHEEFILKQFEVIENPNKTEYQCKGAMLYLIKVGLGLIARNVELLVRLFKDLITLKYEKDWKITDHLNSLIAGINLYVNFVHIEECKVWRDFINNFMNLQRTIDERYFCVIIKSIISLDPVPSCEIVRYIVDSLRNQSNPNILLFMSIFSSLLYKMKPIAPRSNFKSVDEFKGSNGLIPYLDKLSIGFHCKPHHYVFYTGPSVFDEKSKKFDEIRKLLTDEIFNDDKVFSDIFESFVHQHPAEDKPHFIMQFYQMWKGVGQIIRTSIVKHTKSLVFNVLDVSDLSKITPVRLATLMELISGISRATKHWTEEEKKLAIDEILVPVCTPLIRFKGFDISSSFVQVLANLMISDWDYRRTQWFLDIIIKVLSECLQNKENMNEIVLRSSVNMAKIYFIEAGNLINEIYLKTMKDILIPLFSNFKSLKLDYISIFSSLISCRLLLAPQYRPNETRDENYYNAPKNQILTEIASLPFIVFDQHKEESPELVALFLSEIFNDSMCDFSFIIPFISERFSDIITIDSKLVDITSGKFLHYGKNIACRLGLLYWCDLGYDKMEEVVFNDMIKKKLMTKRESLPWNSRLNNVGFLHTLTFSNLFLFTKKELSVIIDDVLPPFLSDSNQEVRAAAKSLLKVLICITYNDCLDSCAEKVNKYFNEASKEKSKLNKNLLVAVSFASALIDNTYVWFNGCPEWLPNIFALLERVYSRGDCKDEIKNSVVDFFTRHRGKEIPEIDDFKYSFSEGYFT